MGLRYRGYYPSDITPPSGFSVYWIPTQEIKAMKKNVSGQVIGVQLINSADGTPFTGVATVLITVDGGSQSASGGVGPTHEGNGYHTYLPTQAETNGDQIGFTWTGSGSITSSVQVYTTFPQSVDNDTKISLIPTTPMRGTDSAATAANLAVVDSNVDAILVDTSTTIPAQITALNDFNPVSDTVANVTLVATTTTNTDMRGTDGANETTPPTTAQIWSEATRTLTAGTNIVLAKGVGVTGFNDLNFDDIWTGSLTESYAADGAVMTPAQGMHMIWSDLRSPQQVSTTWSDFRLDNTTVAMTFTLDDATTPTKKTRAS